jgi:hypothetical protein
MCHDLAKFFEEWIVCEGREYGDGGGRGDRVRGLKVLSLKLGGERVGVR